MLHQVRSSCGREVLANAAESPKRGGQMQTGLKDRLRWFNACVSAAVQPYDALAFVTMVVWPRTGRWGAGAVEGEALGPSQDRTCDNGAIIALGARPTRKEWSERKPSVEDTESARSHWTAGGELLQSTCVTSEDVRTEGWNVAGGCRERRPIQTVLQSVSGDWWGR